MTRAIALETIDISSYKLVKYSHTEVFIFLKVTVCSNIFDKFDKSKLLMHTWLLIQNDVR